MITRRVLRRRIVAWTTRAELSGFLKSRRARLHPEDVGLRDYSGVRRVAGLRREELARVAGMSIAHYTRLEQGKGDSVSDKVLDAIGAALRLDTDELAYLHRIARPPGRVRAPQPRRTCFQACITCWSRS